MTLEQTLKKLISFPTVTGSHKEIHEAFEWIKDELQPVPVYIREYDKNEHPMLVITPSRSKRVKLWLSAHIDVVPADEELFKPKEHDGKLFGRGASDMKFAIACYIDLLKEIGVDIRKYDIGVMLTSDEEWGGHNGVKHLLEREGFRGELVFIPDGTGSWMFEQEAKGKWMLELVTEGVATHGSRPWKGRNAIHELTSFVHELEAGFQDFDTGDADEHWYATASVGTIEGGVSDNVVAPHARAVVDIRYTSEKELHKIKRLLAKLQKQYPHTQTRTLHNDPPYGISKSNGYAKLFSRIAYEQHGINCGWARACGASDARFFNWNGIQTILISPYGGGAHSDREWVDLKDLRRYHDVLKEFIATVAKK